MKKMGGGSPHIKCTVGKRNPVAANLRVNKSKVFKMKTRYDRKRDNAIDRDS